MMRLSEISNSHSSFQLGLKELGKGEAFPEISETGNLEETLGQQLGVWRERPGTKEGGGINALIFFSPLPPSCVGSFLWPTPRKNWLGNFQAQSREGRKIALLGGRESSNQEITLRIFQVDNTYFSYSRKLRVPDSKLHQASGQDQISWHLGTETMGGFE